MLVPLAEHQDHVEAVGLKVSEAVTQLRDAACADGSPGAAMELDENRAITRGGEIERVARRRRAGERWGGIACGQGAILMATVSPSRMGTSVLTKSLSA